MVENWRAARYRLFVSECQPRPGEAILDIGGGTGRALARYNQANPITILEPGEVWDIPIAVSDNVRYEVGDGRALQYADASWPIVFSNSVIEHVGDEAD